MIKINQKFITCIESDDNYWIITFNNKIKLLRTYKKILRETRKLDIQGNIINNILYIPCILGSICFEKENIIIK